MDISHRYRHKRRQSFLRRLVFALCGTVVLIIILWGFFWIPYFRIKTITIDGQVEKNKIELAIQSYLAGMGSFWLPRNNYFLLSLKNVEDLIKEQSFGVAIIDKKFPSSLAIVFPERQAHFIVCADNDQCYYMNESGLIFSEAPQFSNYPLPLLTTPQNTPSFVRIATPAVGNQFAGDHTMQALNYWTENLKKINIESKIIALGEPFATSSSIDFGEMKFFTPDEWYIFVSTAAAPEKTFENLKLLLEQKIKDKNTIEYIDLRFENKAFYKLK